jgi:ketosteroid isomerase-like protein
MAEHPNAAAVRQAQQRFELSGDFMSLADVVDDDVVWHQIGAAEPIRGKQALMEYFESVPTGAIKVDTHDVVANDEHCVMLVTATATTGDRTLTYRTAEIFHVRDGKVTERWAFSDDTQRIIEFFAEG